MEDGIEKIVCKTPAIVVHQVPMQRDDTVDGVAGECLEMHAFGGIAFDDESAVLLRQTRAPGRPRFRIEVRGAGAELA